MTWTTGVFYTRSNENSIENITDPTLDAETGGAACAQLPCPGGSYRSDSLWSYEIGGKNALLGRRLQINSSLFYIDWRDVLSGLPQTKELSLRSGMRWEGLDVSLFAKNLFDQHPVLFENRDFAASYVTLYWQRSVAPRTIGLTASYRY